MTEYQNWPSALRSRATIRAQRGSSAAATCADFFGFSNVVIMAVHFAIFGLRRSSRQHRLAALRLLLSNSILPRTLCSGATAYHALAAARALYNPYIARRGAFAQKARSFPGAAGGCEPGTHVWTAPAWQGV